VTDRSAHWEHFEHESDIGVRGVAPTVAAAFEQAALALTAVVVDPATVREARTVDVACEAADYEMLLVEWLDALIYRMSAGRLVFARFEVTVDAHRLSAKCFGEPIDVARHQPAVEVKAATLCALSVARADGTWIAQCVVDV
jgi:tRNA nucleotidyltransferase (CCA-adding enzyme)